MKKWTVLIACMLVASSAHAQFYDDTDPGDQGPLLERVRAQRIAFITDKMGLTPGEAEKFWPVIREFEEKERATRKKYRPFKRVEDFTDAEAEEALVKRMDMEAELLGLKREYSKKLLQVISARKLLRYHRADLEFKKHILERAGEIRKGNRGGLRN